MEDKQLADYLNQSLETIFRINRDSELTLNSNHPQEVKKAIASELPIDSQSFEELLARFESTIAPYLNQNRSSNYAAYITGSGNPIGAIA